MTRHRQTCSVSSCDRKHKANGYCQAHYSQVRRSGKVTSANVRIFGDDQARFWQKVDTTGDCWEWTAGIFRSTGYGQFGANYQTLYAHRFAYEMLVGPIPEGLEIDHLCRNRSCVNPDHLEPVTKAENNRRAALARPRVR